MKFILNNYTVQYKNNSSPLLHNFSLSCDSNGLYLINGANGAGKSTLFSSLQGLPLAADVAGTVVYNEHTYDITTQEYFNFAQQHVGLVSQKYDEMLAPQYSLQENLQLAMLPKIPSCFKKAQKKSITETLLKIKIPHDVPVEKLSGGQRQISAILMVLQKRKDILLLDEPTATLDPTNTALVMDFLVELQHVKKIIILMICHDPYLSSYTQKPILKV